MPSGTPRRRRCGRACRGSFPLEDGVRFRRGRLAFAGTYQSTIDFNVEIDFTNVFAPADGPAAVADTVAPTELWLTFRKLPFIGNLRVGNQKQPISFEHITSSKYLNFLERSPGFDAFVEGGSNGFSPGVMAFDHFLTEDAGYWAVGVFKTTRVPVRVQLRAERGGPDRPGGRPADLRGRRASGSCTSGWGPATGTWTTG